MSARSIELKLQINFPVILFTVFILHALFFMVKGLPKIDLAYWRKEEPTILKIRQVKISKSEHSNIKPVNSVLHEKKPITSLSDLGLQQKSQRPGTRPEVLPTRKAMSAISLKGEHIKEFAKSSSGGLSVSDLAAGANKISDAVVSIEVPDGVRPDELNEYELMFYGFQKRTAMNYFNSILKNLDKFQKRYPNYKLSDNTKIKMTARLTYDEKGNVKQIKMIRWTHVDEVQNFFEDVVKGIDQLHNPPKALWENHGEFSMFFTLEIITG